MEGTEEVRWWKEMKGRLGWGKVRGEPWETEAETGANGERAFPTVCFVGQEWQQPHLEPGSTCKFWISPQTFSARKPGTFRSLPSNWDAHYSLRITGLKSSLVYLSRHAAPPSWIPVLFCISTWGMVTQKSPNVTLTHTPPLGLMTSRDGKKQL